MPALKQKNYTSFSELMQQYGYALPAIHAVLSKPILDTDATPERLTRRYGVFFDNYYMQFLAMQLGRLGFELNRPFIPLSELNHAAGLIEGRHGNAPLDSARLLELLDAALVAIVKEHTASALTWHEMFAFLYTAEDGSTIRGQDIILALIKADMTHAGALIENYHHTFHGRVLGTCSMMQIMADELASIAPKHLNRINRFGKQVEEEDIVATRAMAKTFPRLRAPRLTDFYSMTLYEKLKQTVNGIFRNLASECDLGELHEQRLQLERDCSNPGIYPPEWRIFLKKLDDMLQRIATPYA